MMTAQEQANKLYPPNHPIDDPEGATGEAQSDPYGYEELGNRAFLEGAAWQAEQYKTLFSRLLAIRQSDLPLAMKNLRIEELLAEWELAQ